VVFVLTVPTLAYSQSTLNFPRAFSPADLATTGFAVVNPATTSASVTFTLYNASGAVAAASPQTVPAAGQFARLGTELFPAAMEAGWVQLTSATSGLQGFWVGGDFKTVTDGADSAPTADDLVFPLVTAGTELNIANTAPSTNSVAIMLFAADGTELASAVTRSIAPAAVLQSQVSALFPAANLDNARYVRATGSAGLTGTAVINGFLVAEWGVTNAVSVASAGTGANLPHVVSGAGGGANYTTVIGVTNLSSSPQTVSITFTPESGSPITVPVPIATNGSLRDTAQHLFNLPPDFQTGWIAITGTAPLTAFVAYADSIAGGFAVVPAQTAPLTSLMFAHIADLPPWLTGLALLNTTSSDATVSVYAMNPDGTLIGGPDNAPTARFTINAGTTTARLLSELIPQTQQRAGDGGFIFITSTQPLYGIELFFSRNLRILANVAAGSGAGFAIPVASAPLVLSSISPLRASRGEALTLTGSGFDAVAANNGVVFTGAAGALSATPSVVSATSLAVTIPAAAITGPVFVQAGGRRSASQVVEVLASSNALVQSSITVNSAVTTTGVDIYVPQPAVGLSVTRIGVGDINSNISYGTSSAEIGRGQTKEMVLDGTGLNQFAGITVAVSGSGVTTSNIRYQDSLIIVRIAVDAAAPAGVRNVIVTNSDLDTSIMTGGLFIR
jgi:hypothetical protein